MLEITPTTPTIAVMREYAEKNGIDLGGATKRQDIADIIQAHDAKNAPIDPPQPPTGDETGAGGTNTQPDEENATAGENNATGDDAEKQNEDGEEPPAENVTENVTPDPEAGSGDPPTDPPKEPEDTAGENVITRLLQGLRLPMRGDDVAAVHARLEEKGISVGTDKADGIYGGRTAYAVRVFQARNRLIVDGRVGKFTARALGFEWEG